MKNTRVSFSVALFVFVTFFSIFYLGREFFFAGLPEEPAALLPSYDRASSSAPVVAREHPDAVFESGVWKKFQVVEVENWDYQYWEWIQTAQLPSGTGLVFWPHQDILILERSVNDGVVGKIEILGGLYEYGPGPTITFGGLEFRWNNGDWEWLDPLE